MAASATGPTDALLFMTRYRLEQELRRYVRDTIGKALARAGGGSVTAEDIRAVTGIPDH
jgi:hypothetical protein